MENEKQQTKLLIPINKEAVEKYTQRLDNPWSLIGGYYRIQRKWRVARMKKVLNSLENCSVNSRSEQELEPLWITMPGYNRYSMAWRMGGGEDLSRKFQIQYRELTEKSKENFQLQYPEPKGWEGFYSSLESGNNRS